MGRRVSVDKSVYKTVKLCATYKCRMCGATFQKGKAVGPYTAARQGEILPEVS